MTISAGFHDRLGALAGPTATARTELESREAVAKLWARDHTLWSDDPTEITNRLGWLDEAQRIDRDELRSVAAAARADGITDVLWCGMGGSSLFPELLGIVFADAPGATLHVLDTSHPVAVARAVDALDPATTLYCFASKSGGTIETRSQLDDCWHRVGDPSRFLAVTDAGSGLDQLATERRFRAVLRANPDIGGRYSALSHFGLVPAALAGIDVDALLAPFDAMATACRGAERATDRDANPAVELAAVLAAGVREGRDKCTILLPAEVAPFGAWAEQLIAESTGKHATGILPVVDEPVGGPEVYGDDRIFFTYGVEADALAALANAGHPVVDLGPFPREQLAAEVLRWEAATALASALLGINPFDQPDVESAKVAARAALDGTPPEIETVPLAEVLALVGTSPDYIAIQAFVDPTPETVAGLERARIRLRDDLHVAVTVGIGPRYLHSTGQLHKGGARDAVCVQVVDDAQPDREIPGTGTTFGRLIHAQAAGDFAALRDAGQRVRRVALDELLAHGG